MKNRIIKIYMILVCFLPCWLTAVPYRFTRLVSEKNGQVDKIFDFFYDFHRDFDLSPKRPSKRGRKFLNPNEQKLFDAPLRGFISSIRELDLKTQQKIGLFWEYEPEGTMENYQLTAQEQEIVAKTGAHIFLRDMGKIFNTEFAPEKNKNIVFIPSDIYRKKEMLDYFDSSKMPPNIPLSEALKPMADVARKQSPGDQAMVKLKAQLPAMKYHYLEQKWTGFQHELKRLMTRAFIPSAGSLLTPFRLRQSQEQKDFIIPSILVKEYLARGNPLEAKFCSAAFKRWQDDIPNFEILFNLLLLNYRHNIIYVGGYHAAQVIEMLKEIGFKKIIDVGVTQPFYYPHIRSSNEEIQPFRLNHNVLRFLFEQPESKSFARYLRNPLEKIENAHKLGSTLVKIFALDKDKSTQDTILATQNFEDLKKLVAQCEKSYVDITNVILDELPMVELLMLHEQFATAEYLMQHGALFSTLAYQETLNAYAEWKRTGKESWYEYFINTVKAMIDSVSG